VARLAEPLRDRGGPEEDDAGNACEAVYRAEGLALLSCSCGCGLAWLEAADFYEDPDPRDASWERRDLGDTYWRAPPETAH
jgi:hypothetical protein